MKVWHRVCAVAMTMVIGLGLMATSASAATVDDVRSLLGYHRTTDEDLAVDYWQVAMNYLAAEQNNFAALISVAGGSVDTDNQEAELQNRAIRAEAEYKEQQFVEAFVNNAPVRELQALLTSVDATLAKQVDAESKGYSFQVEYVPNKYTEEYRRLLSTVNAIGDSYDIGALGSSLKTPIEGYNKVISPFGQVKKLNRNEIILNEGVTWSAPAGSTVMSQWNGTVTAVYDSGIYGKSVEIASGQGLIVNYGGFSQVSVTEGQQVLQYQVIGTSARDIYFTVEVDSVTVNPLLLYGQKGADLYLGWAAENPSLVVDNSILDNVQEHTEPQKDFGYLNMQPLPSINPELAPDEKDAETIVNAEVAGGVERPQPQVRWEQELPDGYAQ